MDLPWVSTPTTHLLSEGEHAAILCQVVTIQEVHPSNIKFIM